jgi:hypothetical protein
MVPMICDRDGSSMVQPDISAWDRLHSTACNTPSLETIDNALEKFRYYCNFIMKFSKFYHEAPSSH